MMERQSICPVCKKRAAAAYNTRGGFVYFDISCSEHGVFSSLASEYPEDFERWTAYSSVCVPPRVVITTQSPEPENPERLSGGRPVEVRSVVNSTSTGLGCPRQTPGVQTPPEGAPEFPDSDSRAFAYTPDIFMRNYRYQLNETPDKGKMDIAAAHFIGTHDFSAFRTASDDAPPDAVRTISALSVDTAEGVDTRGQRITEYALRVTGDGFLYNMVRIIAGTIVEAGLGKRDPADIGAVIESGDRGLAGHTAPASGLYLEKVYYEQDTP
jgi:tRNA pseudouridine(38-40) synthase